MAARVHGGPERCWKEESSSLSSKLLPCSGSYPTCWCAWELTHLHPLVADAKFREALTFWEQWKHLLNRASDSCQERSQNRFLVNSQQSIVARSLCRRGSFNFCGETGSPPTSDRRGDLWLRVPRCAWPPYMVLLCRNLLHAQLLVSTEICDTSEIWRLSYRSCSNRLVWLEALCCAFRSGAPS